MAEKRVSVRLAAVGGRQVRAELEGVGEAGARGFGRLSREMDAANTRLAGFARRVRVAAAAAVAAAMAAGVAMVRSGLQTVDAQAKLAQSLGTTVASIQTLERAGELAGVSMSDIEQATKDLTRRLSQAAAGAGPAAAFFEARHGRLYGFRFKDWSDHKSCLPSQTLAPTDQQFGTGDDTTTAFQLVKRYASGAQAWARTIAKPAAATVRAAIDGVEATSGWTVDRTTGLVVFASAPAAGVAATAGFAFDVSVRFDTDKLDVTLDLERLGSITSIPLVELRR